MESIRRRVHDRNGIAEVITKEDIYTSRQNQSWQKRVGVKMEHEIHNRKCRGHGDEKGHYYEGYEDDKNMEITTKPNPHILPDSIVRLMSKQEQKDYLRQLGQRNEEKL